MKILLIPEFKTADERNKWIVAHAQYFTVVRRTGRTRTRDETYTYDEAVELAKRFVSRCPTHRYLIYAVAGGSDALAATVSADAIKVHT